jgi:hypothetical protein
MAIDIEMDCPIPSSYIYASISYMAIGKMHRHETNQSNHNREVLYVELAPVSQFDRHPRHNRKRHYRQHELNHDCQHEALIIDCALRA